MAPRVMPNKTHARLPVHGGEIRSADIVSLYKSIYGLDVASYLTETSVKVVENERHGYFSLEPMVPGDDDFYSQLMGGLGYDGVEKAEFKQAATLVRGAGSVLDIGCGPGLFSAYCPQDYKGIELNPRAVEAAQKANRHVVEERLEDQPLRSFDCVVMFQVLEHVPEPESFFNAALACVRPGGRLIVSTPNVESFMGFTKNRELNYPPHHLSWWSPNSLSSLFEAAGMEDISVWLEPLQRHHYSAFLYGLLDPAKDKYVDLSAATKLKWLTARLLQHILFRSLPNEAPIPGHSVLVSGLKSFDDV